METLRQLKSLPSRAELAAELGVSERTIGRAISEEDRRRERTQRWTSIGDLLA
jgi:DNA-binding transcriptional regulator YhcF (GntR family)